MAIKRFSHLSVQVSLAIHYYAHCRLLLQVIKILMKRLFREVGRHKGNSHDDDTGDYAALDQAPVPAVLEQVLEHQIDQGQGTADHIGYGGGGGGAQVGAELLRAHRHKNGPETRGKAHHPADQVHGTVAGIEWTEEQEYEDDAGEIEQVECLFTAFEQLAHKARQDIPDRDPHIGIHDGLAGIDGVLAI